MDEAVGGQGGAGGEASARQGQQQGLVGIQGQLGILDNNVDVSNGNEISTTTSTVTSTSTEQGQGQKQGQVGIVKDGDVVDNSEVVVEGDDIVYEAPDIPVNSAAPVFAGACSQGVSVQKRSGGMYSEVFFSNAFIYTPGETWNVEVTAVGSAFTVKITQLNGDVDGGGQSEYVFDFTDAGLSAGLEWDTTTFATTGRIGVVPQPGAVPLLVMAGLSLLACAWRPTRAA